MLLYYKIMNKDIKILKYAAAITFHYKLWPKTRAPNTQARPPIFSHYKAMDHHRALQWSWLAQQQFQ